MSTFPLWWPQPSQPTESVSNLWDELRSQVDPQQYKPARAQGIISKELKDASGRHFILKNAATHSYVRLSPEEFWVWEKMDGETTVQKLVLAYFMQYKAFAFASIISLLDRLREGNMLVEPPHHLYADVNNEIQNQSIWSKLTWVARTVFTREFVIKNLDNKLERIYRYGGWLLFTWPMQLLFFLVSAIGLYIFSNLVRDPQYNLVTLESAYKLGLIVYIPLLIHEFGHAIAAKHVGCEVYKGGGMLYYGMPAAFIDTTDVWMFGKRARLIVTWAGPYTGYIIGGALSLAVNFIPGISHENSVFMLKIAMVSIFITTMNIMPMMKLDGYYLLADALEIPSLRERSMEFIQHTLRTKISKREKWSREEYIFLVFGILAFLSTFYFTIRGVTFWDVQATKSISSILNLQESASDILQNIFIAILGVSTIFYFLTYLVSGGKKVVDWLRQKGLFSTRWRTAFVFLILAPVLTYLPRPLLPTLAGWFLLVSGFIASAFAAWLMFNHFRSMRGSQHAGMWLPAILGALFGAFNFLEQVNARWAESAIPVREAVSILLLLSVLIAGRLLTGLRGGWRAVSLVLLLSSAIVTAYSLFNPLLEIQVIGAFIMLGGALHWSMRPPTLMKTGGHESMDSTRQRMMIAFHEMHVAILSEVKLDFGPTLSERVEKGLYLSRKNRVGNGQFENSMTGMTPNDYGGAIALELDELLAGVENLAGKKYAWRALALGFDRMDWELQEIAEDYILKYVPHAAGLSNKLSEERDDLGLLLRSVPLFMGMSESNIHALSRKFKVCSFGAGEEIVRAGDTGDSFYIVRAGRLEVVGTVDFSSPLYKGEASSSQSDNAVVFSTRMRRITQLARGDYFGEFALLEGKPRAATVRAITPSEVLRLDKSDFDALIRNSITFDETARDEIRRLGMLRQIPLFESFDGGALKSIMHKMKVVKVNPGETIFEQGDSADTFFIIEQGKVIVKIDGEERARLGTGEYFGEIALLMNMPRTATVTALQPSALLMLSVQDFNDLMQEFSSMRQALERASSRRSLSNDRWIKLRQAG